VNSDAPSERDGRWEGKAKTECGLHKDYFKMRAAFIAAKKKKLANAAAPLTLSSTDSDSSSSSN